MQSQQKKFSIYMSKKFNSAIAIALSAFFYTKFALHIDNNLQAYMWIFFALLELLDCSSWTVFNQSLKVPTPKSKNTQMHSK